MKNLNPFIVDERVGCVAVYRGPEENCLAEITSRPDCVFYANFPSDVRSYVYVYIRDEEAVKKAHQICDALNKNNHISTTDAASFMGQTVRITTFRNAIYIGKLDRLKTTEHGDKFHLSNLIICHKNGNPKVWEKNERWFNVISIIHVEKEGE